jgi:hypothetical protein
MGVTHTTRFANFHQPTLMGGQDAITLGVARLKDGLSMTFGLTWRFCSRPSSGGDQMKATVSATYPANLTNLVLGRGPYLLHRKPEVAVRSA